MYIDIIMTKEIYISIVWLTMPSPRANYNNLLVPLIPNRMANHIFTC